MAQDELQIFDDFDAYLKNSDQPIVIMGTGQMMEYLYQTCLQNGISITAFCDNNPEKQMQTIYDLQVFSVSDIAKKHQNPIVLISPWEKEHQESIIKQLENANCLTHYTVQTCILNMKDFQHDDVHIKKVAHAFLMEQKAKADPDFLYIPWFIDFPVTEICSLNCKDCSAFMPYYEQPKHYKKEDLFNMIDTLAEVFDSIGELRFLGGEPLLHPDIFELIAYAESKETFFTVSIVTNGTILPKKEQLERIKAKHFSMLVSDYGDLSKKQDELKAMLHALEIPFTIPFTVKEENWVENTGVMYRNETPEALEHIFSDCIFVNCFAMLDWKIFHCTFLKSAHFLKSVPASEIEFATLIDDTKSRSEIKRELRRYIHETKCVKACNWCPGKSCDDAVYVEPGIQIKGTIPYKKY